MTAREAKKQYRLSQWAGMISECARSGLTVTLWCANNGVTTRSYYYWLRQVREHAASNMDITLTETPGKRGREIAVNMQAPVKATPGGWAMCTLPEQDMETAKSLAIEIGSCRVMAHADVDPELLAIVCKVLVSLC